MGIENKHNDLELEKTIVRKEQLVEASQENREPLIEDEENVEESVLFDTDENKKKEDKDEGEDELLMFNKRLKEKEAELEENVVKFQRLQADFANYKKRVEKEKSEIFLYASEKLVCELLESIDDLERAAEQKNENSDNEALRKGVELVLKKMKETFSRHNIEEIEAIEKPFDVNLHYAVMQEEAEVGVEPETVIEVFQKGYTINNKVIRPSMVKVSK
ncbi:MAG: nucleotide exchange factor GrpE [Clostridiales bacterium]|nr:nucleotide exchange factor GrpE [Clostridiales bacterium]